MGVFINGGISRFRQTLGSEIYVDKTDMIDFLNRVLNTEQKCICVSRPRRFGKSITANMIAAYYEKESDSRSLFEGRKLSKIQNWDCELNKYNVIMIDIADILSSQGSAEKALDYLEAAIIEELKQAYPALAQSMVGGIPEALAFINEVTAEQFIIIIDEWDAFYRDEKYDVQAQKRYINLLRSLFKGNRAKSFIALAYVTGILPIKKYNSESALNNFIEYTMLSTPWLAPYIGFTEPEVIDLCSQYDMDYEKLREWYDGYSFEGTEHIYGPNSVVQAVLRKEYKNYWSQTVAFNSLSTYITMNFDGLKEAVVAMLGGNRVPVNVFDFQNDMTSFQSKDDVLTVLIHLGYLAYDQDRQEAYIPNYEVRQIFEGNLKYTGWSSVITAVQNSERLLKATLHEDEDTVVELIERCHEENTSILEYNDENSLASVITIAYYTARREYTFIRECPSGYGFADIVMLPKAGSQKLPIIIELKWNKNTESAIQQIKEKKYVSVLKGYKGDVLLVGINYDKKTKKHSCTIERVAIEAAAEGNYDSDDMNLFEKTDNN